MGSGATIFSVLLPWRATRCYRWNGKSWRSRKTSDLRVEFASVFHVASLTPQKLQCGRSEIRTGNLHFPISSQVRPTLETHGSPTALKQLLLYSPERLAACGRHTHTHTGLLRRLAQGSRISYFDGPCSPPGTLPSLAEQD